MEKSDLVLSGNHSVYRQYRISGLTLLEVTIVIAVIGIIAGMLLPSLASAKQKARRIQCVNNLRQIGVAAFSYADDRDGMLPPRRLTPNWIEALQPYYGKSQLLYCPEKRSGGHYMINGFNDWFEAHLSSDDYQEFQNYYWPYGMVVPAIKEPSDTILFGDTAHDGAQLHMDFFQGNHLDSLGDTTHGRGANLSMMDGSVQLLRASQTLRPINLWAVSAAYRFLSPVGGP